MTLEIVKRAIMGGFCDHNLSAIRKSAQDAIPTSKPIDWIKACDMISRAGLQCGKTKFFELVSAGAIKRIDSNTYDTQSVGDYINSER